MPREQANHPGLEAAVAKMRDGQVGELGIRAFARAYAKLLDGDRGTLATGELEPVRDVPALEELEEPGDTAEALDRTVVIRLNGGLGTSMGLTGPKSLIHVKPGLSFLDLIARQVLALREATGARLPLVLMDSGATREASLPALARHEDLAGDLPPDFLQHVEPRLRADDLHPLEWPEDPRQEWCPPGHGDLYAALVDSGMLAAMREQGYEYAFVANADNLGAVLEPRILAWFAAERAPFAMEVVEGTPADRKGGHVARRGDRLVLRETAQTPEGEEDSFRDFRRWRFYNTNNLWLDLVALDDALRAGGGVLDLPLIVNPKTVGDVDVLQLESAMGAAIGVFEGARVLQVPRTRFAPVKTTEDLLVVRSDCYDVGGDGRLVAARADGRPPLVELDDRCYKRLPDFDERFPHGPPSLRRCERLTVRGDVRFGRDVVVVGEVDLEGPAEVADGARLGTAHGA